MSRHFPKAGGVPICAGMDIVRFPPILQTFGRYDEPAWFASAPVRDETEDKVLLLVRDPIQRVLQARLAHEESK